MRTVENSLAKILADAEAAVLKVLADAAAAGNYATIDRARALAEKLRDMNQGLDRSNGVRESSAGPSAPSRKKRKGKDKQRKKTKFPKYEFKNGSLYKTGWSKKKREEYVHRVPVAVVNLVSNVLQDFTPTADPVSSERILGAPVLEGSVPSYQTYIVLAFLKDRGIITSVGREGFQLPSEIKSQVDKICREEANPR